MKQLKIIATIATLAFLFSFGIAAAEQAPQKVVDLANGTLAKLGAEPVIVAAVKSENAKGKTLDQIKAMDEKWKATPGIVDYMQVLIDSECGQFLRNLMNGQP